jgi:hypothetical protein
MRFHKRMLWKIRRALAWGLCPLMAGCAIAPPVKVSSEVPDPKQAASRSVAVVEDLYMEDAVEAEKVAGLVRDQLTKNGFTVHEVEKEADLVVIATVDRSNPAAPTGVSSFPRAWRSSDLSYGLGRANMMESQSALRNLGLDFGPQAVPEQQQVKEGLMVTAVARKAWLESLPSEQKQLPIVWRIIAVAPVKKEDITPKLAEAVGSKLNEVASGKAAGPERPSPAPGHRPKKPQQ